MVTRTDVFDTATRAFLRNGAKTSKSHRRAQDRGALWTRITLVVVVSALLLCVVGRSKARYAEKDSRALPSVPRGR